MPVGRGVVVDDGDVVCSLQHAVEVIGVDVDLVVGCCKPVGFADEVGDEGIVAGVGGHIAFIAGEDEDVVEVEVACLENAHHLKSGGGFAVECDCGGADYLP